MKQTDNQNMNEDRSEINITLAGSGLPSHKHKCRHSRLMPRWVGDQYKEAIHIYASTRLRSMHVEYYYSDGLNINLFIFDLLHEFLKTSWQD